MNAAVTEEQAALTEALESFLRKRYSLRARAAALASEEGFSRENWAILAQMGLLGLPFSEADGGYGGTLADLMLVTRLFGAALVIEPYVSCALIAGRLSACSIDHTQKQTLIAPLITGEKLLGLAHWERGERFGGSVSTTRLRSSAGRLLLRGAKTLVPVPGSLSTLLVTARDKNNVLQVCLVPATAAGLTIRSYRTVDSHTAGDVTLDDVCIAEEDILRLPDADASLEHVLLYASAASCAEAVGSMRTLLDMSVDYAKSRKQFGRPIGSFQVLKHRLVDCYAQCELAEGMSQLASWSLSASWPANVAAAKAFIGRCARSIGHEAMQIHGAMGLTDELAVSHHHKRLVMIGTLFGDRHCQTERFVQRSLFTDPRRFTSALPFDSLLADQEQAFRAEVRDFLKLSLSPELRRAVRRQTTPYPDMAVAVAWQRRLHEKGWLAPLWPPELGGAGFTAIERFIFEYESALAGAPEQVPMGFRYVGPVIAKFGTEWQRSYFLPKMLSSEHYWAQGFSEPGAGSDLASLKTTAEWNHDSYVINGSKMWTTHAHFANWLFCIARTAKADKPQEGISFFLIDMSSPGVTVKPIALLGIDHEVNQVFLDNVRVPSTHLVGEAGRGWEYTKFLLEYERGGVVFCGRLRYEFNLVKELINETQAALWRDNTFSHRLAAVEHRLMALEISEYNFASHMRDDTAPGVGGSVFKLLASELQKDITEIGMDVAGFAGLEFEPRRPLYGPDAPSSPGFDLEQTVMARYLNMRVASIYGGSSEIQREIIAKHALGLH